MCTRICCFFFFQAEDGIRDYKVTGVQTCALPIYEEISRLLFVWLVAIGAIVAAFEGSHLGFDLVTSRVGPGARKALFWVSQALVLVCMGLLLWGSWAQEIGRASCRERV